MYCHRSDSYVKLYLAANRYIHSRVCAALAVVVAAGSELLAVAVLVALAPAVVSKFLVVCLLGLWAS